MKRLIIIALLASSCLSALAQSGRPVKMPLVAGDTIVNTGTVTKVFTMSAGYSCLGLQPIVTKISGTVGGNVVFYGSLDNVNFVATGDTLTLANVATNTTLFRKDTTPYQYIKAIATGTGTMSAVFTLYYNLRTYQTNRP